jgi:hypothetical protein
MTVAGDVSISPGELEPAHVLGNTVRRDAGVEEDRPLATARSLRERAPRSPLGDQRVGQAGVGER